MLDYSFEYYPIRCTEIPEVLYFFFTIKQLISCSTRISWSSADIIYHILASYPDRVSRKMKFGISDHHYFILRKLLKLRQSPIYKSISAH